MNKNEFLSTLETWNGIAANSVKRVFFDVNLANSHRGLAAFALAERARIDQLRPGEYFVFINRRKTSVKLLTAYGSTIAYLKMPGSQRLNLLAIQYLPKFFSGGQLDYLGALGKVFKPGLPMRYIRIADKNKMTPVQAP